MFSVGKARVMNPAWASGTAATRASAAMPRCSDLRSRAAPAGRPAAVIAATVGV